MLRKLVITLAFVLLVMPQPTAQNAVDYDIVYVRAPRPDDTTRTMWPEVKDPIFTEPGSDLMLLHPDGSEEMLVDAGDGAVMDPFVSFDGEWVYYSLFYPPVESVRLQRGIPDGGADIYKIHVPTREVVRLTYQEWTPNTAIPWDIDGGPVNSRPAPGKYSLGYAIFNLGATPMPGGKVMFTSNRNGFRPNGGQFTKPVLQLYVMDDDGSNVELVGHLNLGSALHPTILKDGRVMFSSYEAMGMRDNRVWGLWAIWPDGTKWEPLMSAFSAGSAFHWQTQLSDGTIVVTDYYNQNNQGFGSMIGFPAKPPDPNKPPFGPMDLRDPATVRLEMGRFSNQIPFIMRYSTAPQGIRVINGMYQGGGADGASNVDANGVRLGKVTQPSGAPNNQMLVVWSGGPANLLNRPTNLPRVDGGIYLDTDTLTPTTDISQLTLVKNDPAWNEQQPRALVPYRDIYGVDEPVALPWNQNDGRWLEPGTPFGLVGTSSMIGRGTDPANTGHGQSTGFLSCTPGRYLDPFNTHENGSSSNWSWQGAAAGRYCDEDIYAVRIVATDPSSHLSYPYNSEFYESQGNERMRILAEIPVRKDDDNLLTGPVLDPEGNPDTSWIARIPADVPFTFQTIDRNGMTLNMAQTWHQVRPGEKRVNCGGCHRHSEMGLSIENTVAGQPEYVPIDAAEQTPYLTKNDLGETVMQTLPVRYKDVEFARDIVPIFERSCVSCHNKTQMDGQLDLSGTPEEVWTRLNDDHAGAHGIPPLLSCCSNANANGGSWRSGNQSRWLRAFQARRSLLVWKVWGERLDGWTNEDHPTEDVPGDPTTLPEGGSRQEVNRADIDYTGTIMPPPDSGLPPLTWDEKMAIARWVDMGSPFTNVDRIARQNPPGNVGFDLDDLRPTLTLQSPAAGHNETISVIRLGAFDYKSGLDPESLSVIALVPVNGNPVGTELAHLFTRNAWTWELPITDIGDGEIVVSVKDNAGNKTVIERSFTVGAIVPDPDPEPEPEPDPEPEPHDHPHTHDDLTALIEALQAQVGDLTAAIQALIDSWSSR